MEQVKVPKRDRKVVTAEADSVESNQGQDQDKTQLIRNLEAKVRQLEAELATTLKQV